MCPLVLNKVNSGSSSCQLVRTTTMAWHMTAIDVSWLSSVPSFVSSSWVRKWIKLPSPQDAPKVVYTRRRQLLNSFTDPNVERLKAIMGHEGEVFSWSLLFIILLGIRSSYALMNLRYIPSPLKTFGSVPSSSIISKTLFEALRSVNAATQTSATKSLEISPALRVSSP